MTHVSPGRLGVWTWGFDAQPAAELAATAAAIEAMGYGAVWFGESTGRDAPTNAALLLGATTRLVVAAGVANVYRHDPRTLAQAERSLAEAYPGRFVLGLGVGARQLVESRGQTWERPLAKVAGFLDAMDAAPLTAPAPPVPARRVLAALGPRMLELAAARTWGAHPFFLPVEHTAWARGVVGPDAYLAVHQATAMHDDPATARADARERIGAWLGSRVLVPSRWDRVRELTGLDTSDLGDGGSDRLGDAMIAVGDVDVVAERVRAQWAAGADHVAVGVDRVTADGRPALDATALADLRRLATALL